jgi:hypothetical protein
VIRRQHSANDQRKDNQRDEEFLPEGEFDYALYHE